MLRQEASIPITKSCLSVGFENISKQAGAELCQAQEKLELTKPAIRNCKIEVVFHFAKKIDNRYRYWYDFTYIGIGLRLRFKLLIAIGICLI